VTEQQTADAVQEIAGGYATEGAAVELGAVMVGGKATAGAGVRLPLAMMNRHGLAAGVPAVLADVKGDLSGMSQPGAANDKITKRAADIGDDWQPAGFPVQFLSLGTTGIGTPIRATITSFGPVLLSKVLGLNETQESTLGLIFHWADKKGLALLDTKDLRSVIQYLTSDEGKADLEGIGGVSSSTAGVILRALSNLEAQGGDDFFGEPELDVQDLVRQLDGKGVVSLLELGNVQANPQLFSTFLMWLLAELFEEFPEAGDLDKPKLVFFFDEAHLLFSDASKAFLDRIEQTVKLIRSKGIGIFFCTQLPTDIPNEVLSQLGARIQHALRAFTPEDQQALAKTVKTYPTSKVYDLEEALTGLGIGEAIVTVLSERGAPTPVAWTLLRAPRSTMASIGDEAIKAAAAGSELHAKYAKTVDAESAYEKLAAKVAAAPAEAPAPADAPAAEKPAPKPKRETEEAGAFQKAMKNPAVRGFFRSAASALGREITRGLFGNRRR
jgi:DNA helicase HerA-like ATPase